MKDVINSAVAEALKQYSDIFDSVTFEYPGYILIHADGAAWAIGTANGPVGADYYANAEAHVNGESPDQSIEITVPEGATDIDVADAIYAAMVNLDPAR